MLRNLRLPLPELPTRRTTPSPRGHRIDLRATLRRATGAAGTLSPLAWRRRQRRTPPLVVLCDISGSMDRYARMLLHFLHAITNDRDRVHVLLFGTRLTNVTRHLQASRCRRRAVARDHGRVRLGRRHADRQLPRGIQPTLVAPAARARTPSCCSSATASKPTPAKDLGRQTERLHKSCRRLVWLNPLLRYEGFEARPAGIKAMLPHVDDFLPVHNFESLTAARGSARTSAAARTLPQRRPRRRAH